jgi:DeoR family ulaG and ulaABCDEF operon transcriptional repressor
MHAAEREQAIMALMQASGFISFQRLQQDLTASAATIRRDLDRMERAGLLQRVHGGAQLPGSSMAQGLAGAPRLNGVPFAENINRNRAAKDRIGRAAAALCRQGEAVMIDGGSTTLQMCPHVAGMGLQVLTNSLHIISALVGQPGTRLLVPGGAVFPEQNIILGTDGEDLIPRLHAPRLFMGAAALGPQGLMQADVVLVSLERRLIERAEQVIVLADSSKFGNGSGYVVCDLADIDVLITDDGIDAEQRAMLEATNVQLLIA